MVNVLGMIFSSSLQEHRRTEFKARLDEIRIKEKLSRLASVDELTGVFNRRKLIQLATAEFERFKNNGHQFSVLMIDLDDFKQINDTYGHEFGDRFLCQVAERLRFTLRQSDIISRHGGDEFTLLLHGMKRKEDVVRVATNIFRSFEKPVIIDEHEIFIRASMGISFFPDHGCDIDTLLNKADGAMYTVKKAEKNSFAILPFNEPHL
jgi:diguanylate cyclase (GGDEF)-like protein